MSDHVVCPVCRSRNTPDAHACVTCGAPFADARLPAAPEPSTELAGESAGPGVGPGFGLWAEAPAGPAGAAPGTGEDAGPTGQDEPATALDGVPAAGAPGSPIGVTTGEAAAPDAGPALDGATDEPAADAPMESGPWGPLAQPAEPWPADAWPPGPTRAADAGGATPTPAPSGAAPVLPPAVAAATATSGTEAAQPPTPLPQVETAADAAAAAAMVESGGATISPAPGARSGPAADDPDEDGWLPVSAAADADLAGKPGVCWNCGQKNARSREYCKRCGQRLHSDVAADEDALATLGPPVKGGPGKRAVAFVWTVLVLAAVVVVGVVAFGGFLPRSDEPSPPPVTAALPSSSPAASSIVGTTPVPTVEATPTPRPTPSPTPRPTATPAPTPTPSPTLQPTPSPVPTPRANVPSPGAITTTASPRAPAPVAWSCKDPVSMRDPLDRAWIATGIYHADRGTFDRITVRLTPDPQARGDETRVNVSIRRPEELVAMGLPQPAEGEVAVVIRLSDDIALLRQMQLLTERPAVRTLSATTASDGRAAIVLGVAGKGCVAFQAPSWDEPSTQHTPFVDLTVDVQH